MEMLAAIFKLCLMIGIVVAFRDYQKQIPNGDRVPDPCHPNKLWQGVGHKQVSGGGLVILSAKILRKLER